jgi:hypothetical protein
MTTASQTQPAAVKNNQRLANASEKNTSWKWSTDITSGKVVNTFLTFLHVLFLLATSYWQ